MVQRVGDRCRDAVHEPGAKDLAQKLRAVADAKDRLVAAQRRPDQGAVRSGMAVSAILAEDCPEPDLRIDYPLLPKLPQLSLAFRFAKADPPVLVRAPERRLRGV